MADEAVKEWNVLQRLAEVQRRVTYVQKEKGGDLKYAIVTHDAVTASVRPHMVAVGVLYYPLKLAVLGQNQITSKTKFGERTEHRCEIHMTTRFVNVDDPADYIDVQAVAHGMDTGDKGPGKAISYAMKFCLLKALGLETGEKEESEYDQEDRQPLSAQETTLRNFEDAVAMATTTDELRQASDKYGKELGPLKVDKIWKADTIRVLRDWQARMAELKKFEASKPKANGDALAEILDENGEIEDEDEETGEVEEERPFPGDKPQPGTKARTEHDARERAQTAAGRKPAARTTTRR